MATEEIGSAGASKSSESTSNNGDPQAKIESRLASARIEDPDGEVTNVEDGAKSREVSALTIGRMMGLATKADLDLFGKKLDVMAGRVNNMTVRMEKVLAAVANAPTGSDLERIDVQIGALRSMIKDLMISGVISPEEEAPPAKAKKLVVEEEPKEEAAPAAAE